MTNNLTRHPNELSIHASLRGMPELADTDPEFLALIDSLADNGYLRKVLIDEHDQIVDGRHLNRAARALGHKEVPVEIVPEDQIESVILATLLARRHYTKGALAYLSLPLLDEAVRQGAIRKKANLKKGRIPESVLSRPSVEGRSTDSIAERIGVSGPLLEQAKKVEAAFLKSDARLQAWLKVTPGASAFWEGVDFGRRGDWSAFRECWIAEQAPDPQAGALELDKVVPECLRDKFLPQLFSGDLGLGGILKGAGMFLNESSDRGRPDLSEDYALMLDTTLKRAKSQVKQTWLHFEKLQPEDQGETIAAYLETLAEAPKAVLQSTWAHLTAMRKEGQLS
jgi:hypothetical protein